MSMPPRAQDAAARQGAGERYGENVVAAAQQLALWLSGVQGMLMIPSGTGVPDSGVGGGIAGRDSEGGEL